MRTDKRRFGYSRDKRSDCVQVVIALIVQPQGFPLAYECWRANTWTNDAEGIFAKDRNPIRQGRAHLADDRGIPTEEVLGGNAHSDPPRSSMWWHAQGRLTRLRSNWWKNPGQRGAQSESETLGADKASCNVLAESHDRIAKERSMRRRRLKCAVGRSSTERHDAHA